MVFRTSAELRRAELGGDCKYHTGSSPGGKVSHPEAAGASPRLEGHRGGVELLPGDAEPRLCRGALTCIAEPYLTPGAHLGRGVGGGRRGRGQSSLAGRGAGRRAALRMRASPRLGAREPGPPGWLAWEWGALVGAVPHPGPVPSRRDLFTPRPAAAAAAAGGGGGQPLGPAAPRPIGAQHANEGARHTAASAGRATPPPLRLGRPEMRLPPAVHSPPSGPARPGPAAPRASRGS